MLSSGMTRTCEAKNCGSNSPNGGWVLTRPEYFLLTPFSPYSRPLFLHTVNDHVIFHDNDDGGGGDVDDDEKPLVGIAC